VRFTNKFRALERQQADLNHHELYFHEPADISQGFFISAMLFEIRLIDLKTGEKKYGR